MADLDPNDYDFILLACRPEVITAEYPTSIPMPMQHEGSVLVACEACGVNVWLGPAQRAKKYELGDRAMVACMMDAIRLSAANINRVDVKALTKKVAGPDPRWPYG